jgi:alkanesulfonate monooxygenase SsuD/methylene tetrahydromethanopterin reductase-like flavin-dependent oxidoreductase (luciferase family)
MLAKTAVTIDRLSGGRFELGLGAGWLEQEFAAFGYRFGTVGERFDRLETTLEVVNALLGHDGPVTLDAGGVSLAGATLEPPAMSRPLPVWVGGKGGPRLLGLAARLASGWNVVWRMSPRDYADATVRVNAACEAAPRDPATFRRAVGLYTIVADDESAARAAFERARSAMPGGALDNESYESWCADTLSGTPDQALERIATFEALGVEEIVVAPWVLPFAIPEPERVEVFADRVLRPLRA